MIGLVLSRVITLTRAVPWPVWLALAVLLTGWIYGNHRYAEGTQAERARWEARAAIAKAEADAATITAAETRATDTERNRADDQARMDAARTGGRRAANCERLRQARPDFDAAAAGC
jgi:hypothetical protein